MPYIEETIIAGKVKEKKKYHTSQYKSVKSKRNKKNKKTETDIAKNNENRAWRKLYLLLNANYIRGDIRIDLTYKEPAPSAEEAKKNLARFFKNLQYRYKKFSAILKYIAVTEHAGHRIHHHIIINAIKEIGREEIAQIWPYAKLSYKSYRLFDGEPEDCENIANYFLKETNNTFNTDNRVHGLRWVSSKNLIRPEPKTRIIKKSDTWKEPAKPDAGYYISIQEKGVTKGNYPYQFIRMIKLDEIKPKEAARNEKLEQHLPKKSRKRKCEKQAKSSKNSVHHNTDITTAKNVQFMICATPRRICGRMVNKLKNCEYRKKRRGKAIMASMTVKAYLAKVNEICKTEDAAGRCASTGNASRKNCPLWEFKCGIPTNKKHIDTVIELVKSYEATNTGKCSKCGRDNTELSNKQDIKFCPYCGQPTRREEGKDDGKP